MVSKLESCIASCHPIDPLAKLPTRLIFIGHFGSTQPVRLVTTGLPNDNQHHPSFSSGSLPSSSPVRYAALSYCWGPPHAASRQLKTTADSLRAMHVALPPVKEMPPVLREAIRMCHRLNIEYLWVDSICIVQGDETDWAAESARMGDVYRNAYVTLCPLRSASCL